MKNLKAQATILAIIFIAVVLVATGYLYLQSRDLKSQLVSNNGAANIPVPTKPEVNPTQPTATPTDETTDWKTYISPNKLFSVSLPTNWELDETNGISINIGGYSLGQISIHTRSDKEYVEGIWKSVNCTNGESGNQPGCAADTNKEVKVLDINNNTVYWKVNSNGSKHAYIPNSPSNKTVEITFPPADQKMVDQILSTFKFL